MAGKSLEDRSERLLGVILILVCSQSAIGDLARGTVLVEGTESLASLC